MRQCLMLAVVSRAARAVAPPRARPRPGWRARSPTAADVEVVEKHQLGHPAQAIGVPTASRCRHGYPQAVLQNPGAHKFGAGLLRLTCPHLCEAVDAWEAEDAVRTLSAELLGDAGGRAALDKVNRRHAATRAALIDDDARSRAEARLGEKAVAHAMSSGLAGISQGKLTDLKCLHAQLADELLSGDNALGQEILAGLERRGVDVAGSESCREQCAGCAGGWRYTPQKNKQKLWATKARREEMKALQAQGFATALGPGRPVAQP